MWLVQGRRITHPLLIEKSSEKRVKMPEITINGKVKIQEVKFAWKEYMINETLPTVYFLENNGIDNNSKPVEWVNIFHSVEEGQE